MKTTKNVARVASGVEIGGIRLVEANAKTRIRSVHEVTGSGANLMLSPTATVVEGPDSSGFFLVLATMDARVVPDEGDGEPFVHVLVRFELRYRLREGFTATRSDLNEFARGNGIFNAWPYFREAIQTATARMDLPPVVLPLYRFETGPKTLSASSSGHGAKGATVERKKTDGPGSTKPN